jgi:hypothetical protein
VAARPCCSILETSGVQVAAADVGPCGDGVRRGKAATFSEQVVVVGIRLVGMLCFCQATKGVGAFCKNK